MTLLIALSHLQERLESDLNLLEPSLAAALSINRSSNQRTPCFLVLWQNFLPEEDGKQKCRAIAARICLNHCYIKVLFD